MNGAGTLPLAEIFVVLFGAGGIVGGLIALFKAGPERNKIEMDISDKAVIIQSTVLDEVNARYENVIRENGELRDQFNELSSGLKKEVDRLTEENAELTRENTQLRETNEALEHKVEVLTNRVNVLEGTDSSD